MQYQFSYCCTTPNTQECQSGIRTLTRTHGMWNGKDLRFGNETWIVEQSRLWTVVGTENPTRMTRSHETSLEWNWFLRLLKNGRNLKISETIVLVDSPYHNIYQQQKEGFLVGAKLKTLFTAKYRRGSDLRFYSTVFYLQKCNQTRQELRDISDFFLKTSILELSIV